MTCTGKLYLKKEEEWGEEEGEGREEGEEKKKKEDTNFH